MIPTMKSDDLKQFVREGVINAMVDKVNEQFQDVVDIHNGFKCIVDTRKLSFTTTQIGPITGHPTEMTNWAVFNIEFDADEFPARAVIRTFNNTHKTGLYERAASVEYNRNTHQLLVDTGNKTGPGEIYIEMWKQIRN